MNVVHEVLLFVMFLIGSAFYSGMETGIVSINRVRLRHLVKRRNRRALQLEKFLDNPDQMLATSLVGTNICNTAFTVIGTRIFVDVLQSRELGGAVAAVVLTLLILIFGEYLPKAWFQSHPFIRASRYVPLFKLSGWMFHVISTPVIWTVRTLIPPSSTHAEDTERNSRITRNDVQFLLSRESGATPDLSEQRRRMVVGVFGLSEKTAADVMILRDQMLLIKNNTPMKEILELARRSPVKSFPVYSDAEKRFTGILKLSDLFERIDEEDLKVPDLIRPPQYVDEETPADDLLPRLRMSRQSMLLVRDDQGTVTGFVTTDVVLEEIVGPLYDK
jgi:putative hemolysin